MTSRLISATRLAVTSAAVCAVASPAFAHHPMGGATPETAWHGLLSGFGHPVIGIDHFAFVIAVGLASAFLANRWLAPLCFIVATMAGTLLVHGGMALPAAEFVITASVVLVGAMVLSGKAFSTALYASIFALAGLFHGGAYGEAIVGAEATPLVAYLIGFGIVQYAIVLAVGQIVRTVWKATDPAAISPRLAGAVTAGIGFAFFAENVEGLLFK